MSEETIAQMRASIEALQKENKALLKNNDSLLKENRTMKASTVFAEAGLPSTAAELFIAVNTDAEITPEAAKEFAASYGIGAAEQPSGESEQTTETSTPARDQALANISRAGSAGTQGGTAITEGKVLSRDEFLALKQTDPVGASKALAEGRVKLRVDNPYGQGAIPGLANPFAAAHVASSDS